MVETTPKKIHHHPFDPSRIVEASGYFLVLHYVDIYSTVQQSVYYSKVLYSILHVVFAYGWDGDSRDYEEFTPSQVAMNNFYDEETRKPAASKGLASCILIRDSTRLSVKCTYSLSTRTEL